MRPNKTNFELCTFRSVKPVVNNISHMLFYVNEMTSDSKRKVQSLTSHEKQLHYFIVKVCKDRICLVFLK